MRSYPPIVLINVLLVFSVLRFSINKRIILTNTLHFYYPFNDFFAFSGVVKLHRFTRVNASISVLLYAHNTPKMILSIGNDHAGPDYKKALVAALEKAGHTLLNHGTDTSDSVDYPDFGHPVALDVESGRAQFGVVICGSGNGIAMTANKHQGVRAALCWMKEIAILARQHNDANIIALPARFTSVTQCVEMVEAFLRTEFEGGRHAGRVAKIACS